jgi:integrase
VEGGRMSTKAATKFSPAVIARANRCGVYQKAPGGAFYADFRAFAAWGGKQSALVPDGEHHATRDRSVATALFAKRQHSMMELAEAGPRTAALAPRAPRFGPFIEEHLLRKSRDGKSSRGTLRRDEIALRLWFDFLGNCELSDITPLRIQAFIDKRRAQPGRCPRTTLSNATVRNDIHALSNLLKRAHSLRHVSENVITGSFDKPAPPPSRTEFLERDECARLLDAAAEMDQEARVACQIRELQRQERALRDAGDHASARAVKRELQGLFLAAGLAHIHGTVEPILETVVSLFLYTGMRHEELLGLLVRDLDFVNGTVHLRANDYRKLKRKSHARQVDMWPGLRATLERFLAESGRTEGLLFPILDAKGNEKMRHSFAKQFDRVLRRAGLAHRAISPHTLRHTFTSFMLLTTIRTRSGTEAVRSTWDVAQLLGHKSDKLVRDTYAHIVDRREYLNSLDFEFPRRFPSTRSE